MARACFSLADGMEFAAAFVQEQGDTARPRSARARKRFASRTMKPLLSASWWTECGPRESRYTITINYQVISGTPSRAALPFKRWTCKIMHTHLFGSDKASFSEGIRPASVVGFIQEKPPLSDGFLISLKRSQHSAILLVTKKITGPHKELQFLVGVRIERAQTSYQSSLLPAVSISLL